MNSASMKMAVVAAAAGGDDDADGDGHSFDDAVRHSMDATHRLRSSCCCCCGGGADAADSADVAAAAVQCCVSNAPTSDWRTVGIGSNLQRNAKRFSRET